MKSSACFVVAIHVVAGLMGNDADLPRGFQGGIIFKVL